MSTSAQDAYLRSAVLTASPEQLQLMLYDGAIRFVTQGREAIEARDFEKVYDRLTRAQRIILEMQGSLRHEVSPELCAQISALYDFIYRRLIDACVHHDVQSIDDALRILNHQRETWVMLMDKVREERAADAGDLKRPAGPNPTLRLVPADAESTVSFEG